MNWRGAGWVLVVVGAAGTSLAAWAIINNQSIASEYGGEPYTGEWPFVLAGSVIFVVTGLALLTRAKRPPE